MIIDNDEVIGGVPVGIPEDIEIHLDETCDGEQDIYDERDDDK